MRGRLKGGGDKRGGALEMKTASLSSSSPRLVSAPHHGSWLSLPSLVDHGVHELEDVHGTKLEGAARAQHRGLVDALPVDKGVGVRAVGRHGHHALAVHEVAVVGQDPRAEQLEREKTGEKRTVSATSPGRSSRVNSSYIRGSTSKSNWNCTFIFAEKSDDMSSVFVLTRV